VAVTTSSSAISVSGLVMTRIVAAASRRKPQPMAKTLVSPALWASANLAVTVDWAVWGWLATTCTNAGPAARAGPATNNPIIGITDSTKRLENTSRDAIPLTIWLTARKSANHAKASHRKSNSKTASQLSARRQFCLLITITLWPSLRIKINFSIDVLDMELQYWEQ
jgi:hypothetical protein